MMAILTHSLALILLKALFTLQVKLHFSWQLVPELCECYNITLAMNIQHAVLLAHDWIVKVSIALPYLPTSGTNFLAK